MKIAITLVLLTISAPCLGAVSAMVDQDEIDETQVVMLSVAVSGSQNYSEPDWTVLDNDFHLAARSQHRENVEIVNGRVRRILSWEVYLIPKRAGSLTIPSFRFGNEETDPITIVVSEIDPELRRQINEHVFFETTIEPQEPYVQAAIHVTRRLYYSNSVQVRPEQFGPLSIEDALVVEIGDVKRSFSVRGDSHHNVLIRRSVVFAERSGKLTIPASQVLVRLSLGSRDVTLPIFSESKVLRILPIPNDYPADHNWFPASDVRIQDSLDSSDLEGLSVGDSIVREVEITAIDSHSTGIPEVILNTHDSIRQYPDPPKLSDAALVDSVVGKRIQSETLLLTKPGAIEIPQTEVTWWDPQDKQVKQTIIEPRVINVASGLLGDSVEDQAVGANVPIGSEQEAETLATSRFLLPPWPVLVFLCIFLGLIVALLVLFVSRRSWPFSKEPMAPAMGLIRKGLRSKHPSEVKTAMADWLVAHLHVARVEALQILNSNVEAERILNHLNESIFTERPYTPLVNSRELKNILRQIVNNQKHRKISSDSFLNIYEEMGTGLSSAS